MFGRDYAGNFGLPGMPVLPVSGMDPQGGMFGPSFSPMEQGQPVPGMPGAGTLNARNSPSVAGPAGSPLGVGMAQSQPDAGIGQSANPSVDALRSANPLGAGSLGGVGSNNLAAGAGASPQPGAGAPAIQYARPGFGV